MVEALDMSLEDIIKTNKKSGQPSSRGRGPRSSRPGPARRFPNRAANRTTPYAKQYDTFMDQSTQVGRASAVETGTKLYISNLNYEISNEDIKDLFSEFGDLKRYSIHYDRSGRSKGTAEVIFSRSVDAVAAVKKYNNVELDGRPMKIEIVGRNIVTPAAVPPARNDIFGNQNGARRSGQGRGGATGWTHGGGRGARRGRGRGRGRAEKISAEDLDADLASYHENAKQVN